LKRNFSLKLIKEVRPSLAKLIGSLSALFQWTKLPESETLVFTGTRKPGNQNQYQKYQSRIAQAQFQGVKVGFSEN
jgi:hypothetical protein